MSFRAVPGGKVGAVPKPKMTVMEAMSFLAASHQIRCLALMALAQGISTNLIDVRPMPQPQLSSPGLLYVMDSRHGIGTIRLSQSSQL